MFYYIMSFSPVAVKIDGEYKGIASKNYKIAVLDGEHLLEFICVAGKNQPTSCIINNGKLITSNKNIQLIDLYGGFLIIVTLSRAVGGGFKLIEQKMLDEVNQKIVYTVYKESYIKLIVETDLDMTIESLPFEPTNICHHLISNGSNFLILVFSREKLCYILVYKLTSKVQLLYKNLATSYQLIDNKMIITEQKHDILHHKIVAEWEFTDKLEISNYHISQKCPSYKLIDSVIPFAFFEEVQIDGNIEQFLSPALQNKASDIKHFVGEFNQILPPPHFLKDIGVILLSGGSHKKIKLELENGLVSNIIEL